MRCTVCDATDFELISHEMIEKIAAVEGGLQEETTYDGRKLRWSDEARRGLWTMKNAYQRRRVKARVEKRARMMRLDAITLDFARQVIEDETGTPLDIKSPSDGMTPGAPKATVAAASAEEGGAQPPAMDSGAKLVARDDRKNPLISTFDWTDEATQRIFRVPAGFMRSQTQERIEELARSRAEASGEGGTIDLKLVEDGIEIGKKMMAEMISTYSSAKSASPGVATPAPDSARTAPAGEPAPEAPAAKGSSYLNEVSQLTARDASGEHRKA